MTTILIADYHAASRELVREALEGPDVRVIEVSDGREALSAISEELPAVVFADVRMPEFGGIGAVDAVRALVPTRDVRMIAVTAFAMEADRQRILDAGFDEFAAKPVPVAAIRRMVAESRPKSMAASI